MAMFTQEQLKQVLEGVLEGLGPGELGEDTGAYTALYPAGVSEREVAAAVPHFPQLHPLMAQLVQQTISLPEYPVWVDEEEQAGCLLSFALARSDKQYCGLFARCLAQQDLDHETTQNEYIREVVEKWGPCKETAQIVAARADNPGQHGPEIVGELLDEYEELAAYLEDAGGWEVPPTAVPSVSIERIEKAKSAAQLEKYYRQVEADFINEFVPAIVDVVVAHRDAGEPLITVLALHLAPAKGRVTCSITDETGKVQHAYQTLRLNCLAPFDLLCSRLGHRTHKRVKVIALQYMGSPPEDSFKKPFKIETSLD